MGIREEILIFFSMRKLPTTQFKRYIKKTSAKLKNNRRRFSIIIKLDILLLSEI